MRLRIGMLSIASLLVSVAAVQAADSFKIDPVHASVVYRIGHLGVSNLYGRFDDPTGTVTLDRDDASKSSFTFEVQANKVDSGNPKRDQHLQSPDFFDAKQFPTISFKSTAVKATGDKFEVTGDLTMHGVTKSITLNIDKTGEADTQMGHRAGFRDASRSQAQRLRDQWSQGRRRR